MQCAKMRARVCARQAIAPCSLVRQRRYVSTSIIRQVMPWDSTLIPLARPRRCLCAPTAGFEFSTTLLQHIETKRARLNEVTDQLGSGADLSSADRVKLGRELGRLQAIAHHADHVPQRRQELEDLRAMLHEYSAAPGAADDSTSGDDETSRAEADAEIDGELREMALAELADCERSAFALEHELKVLFMPRDPADAGDAIVEVRAGTGGDEAALFAADVFDMYERLAARKGWNFERLRFSATDLGGVTAASATVEGDGAFGFLKFESGVHRVQRVPATERQGRLHTSAISVAVLPVVEEQEFDFSPSDLRIDTYRASGAGGQHVNTTESAVRITHLPTGTVVAIQDERSQHKNKAKALNLLRARVYESERAKQQGEAQAARSELLGSGDRSERIRTYNFKEDRISDHRISATKYGMDAMLRGELLDEFGAELQSKDEEQQLQKLDW